MLSKTKIFSLRWLPSLSLVLVVAAAASIWLWRRPATRFSCQKVDADEFRLVTWNVGYFALTNDKNARDVDISRISEVLKDISADVAVVQELRSLKQADMIAQLLGDAWHAHAVKTGHGEQVLAVFSKLSDNAVDVHEGGGRKLIGLSLCDDRGRRLYIVAVHSPHPGRGMPETIANIRSAISLLMSRDESVRIMAGDFNYNFDPDGNGFGDSALYEEITKAAADSSAEIGETYYGHTRIDHVFHFPKKMKVVPEASGMVDLSPRFANVPGFRDHRPVVVTYDLAGIL